MGLILFKNLTVLFATAGKILFFSRSKDIVIFSDTVYVVMATDLLRWAVLG